MTRIALLGCGGFIGSHFLDAALADPGVQVEGWDWSSDKISHHLGHERFAFHAGDLYCFPGLAERLAECDVVIALAAICNPSQYNTRGVDVIESNFIQPRLIADLCARLGRWLIQFSTSEVYGQTLAHWTRDARPDSSVEPPSEHVILDEEQSPMLLGPVSAQRWSYACAKQLLERYIIALHREQGLDYTLIRPFNFLGTRMDFLPGREGEGLPRVLACFTAALLDKRPLTLVDGGHALRTFLAVEEAVQALLGMVKNPVQAKNRIFNLGNPENEVSIRQLAQTMRDIAVEVTGDSSYAELPLLDVPALEFYGEGYADSDRRMPNIERARQALHWNPKRDLRDILRSVIADAFQIHGAVESAALSPKRS